MIDQNNSKMIKRDEQERIGVWAGKDNEVVYGYFYSIFIYCIHYSCPRISLTVLPLLAAILAGVLIKLNPFSVALTTL